MTNLFKKSKKGLTLIEAAMVLAIATLVVAGIMIFFQNASVNSKANESMAQLSALQSSVRTVYGGQPSYTGLSEADLIASREVPNKMVASPTELRNAFNGTVVIVPETLGTGSADNGFSVEYQNIPFEACTKMGVFDLGTGIAQFEINGGNVALPATVATVQAACDGGGNNGGNSTMKWYMY